MLDLELVTFVAALVFTLKGWVTWYRDILLVNPLRVSRAQRFILAIVPIFCLLFVSLTLKKLADITVREGSLYFGFYLLLGAAWIGAATLFFPFLGLSARDDILERGNAVCTWPIVGALVGVTCSFVGANIGNGPGVSVVLLCAALSSGLFSTLWLTLESLTSISDAITIDRSPGAAVRLAGFLAGAGILSGWSVAGDWISVSATLKDFLFSLWPAVLLTAIAATFELAFRRKLNPTPRPTVRSAVVSALYTGGAITWVAVRGVRS